MITVMGAAGHTGSRIAQALLDAGEPVRALGRSRDALAPLARAGAERRIGDFNDAAFLADAFRGADAVYILLAPSPRSADYRAAQDRMGEAIAQALRASRVTHAVALSSLGADVPGDTGLIAGLHAQERRLGQVDGLDLLLLRPASFFENLEGQLALIERQGVMADAFEPDAPMPMVAARDVAQAAVCALRSRAWRGLEVRELLGPRDIAHAEVARILGACLRRPALRYVRLGDDDIASALAQAGMSASYAALYVGMASAIRAGSLQPRRGRNEANTTPTCFEHWADGLASAALR